MKKPEREERHRQREQDEDRAHHRVDQSEQQRDDERGDEVLHLDRAEEVRQHEECGRVDEPARSVASCPLPTRFAPSRAAAPRSPWPPPPPRPGRACAEPAAEVSRAIAASASIQPGRSLRHGMQRGTPCRPRRGRFPCLRSRSLRASRGSRTRSRGRPRRRGRAPSAPSSASTVAVYGFSHCARPKRDWKAICHAPSGELELGREQARGLLAFAVIRIAPVERVLRHAVKAHHQRSGPAVRAPVFADEVAERADVGRDGRESACTTRSSGTLRHPRQRRADRVERGRGRARRVLGIERQHEDAIAAGALELRRAPRRSMARRSASRSRRRAAREALAEQPLQQLRLALRCRPQAASLRASRSRRSARPSGFGRVLRTKRAGSAFQIARGISTTRGSDRNSRR